MFTAHVLLAKIVLGAINISRGKVTTSTFIGQMVMNYKWNSMDCFRGLMDFTAFVNHRDFIWLLIEEVLVLIKWHSTISSRKNRPFGKKSNLHFSSKLVLWHFFAFLWVQKKKIFLLPDIEHYIFGKIVVVHWKIVQIVTWRQILK